MGVGQPFSIKLRNVHLPHPHPNGGLSDSFHGGGVVLALFLAVTVVGRSTAGGARDVLSVEGGAHIFSYVVAHEQTLCMCTSSFYMYYITIMLFLVFVFASSVPSRGKTSLLNTRYMHAHHVPHAEHVQGLDEMVKRSRDYVEDFEDVSGTPCCPPPVLFTAQRAKLSRVFNGQNYL